MIQINQITNDTFIGHFQRGTGDFLDDHVQFSTRKVATKLWMLSSDTLAAPDQTLAFSSENMPQDSTNHESDGAGAGRGICSLRSCISRWERLDALTCAYGFVPCQLL